jgi:hypothetical protein
MKLLWVGIFSISCFTSFAQKESFDVIAYSIPIGWQKSSSETNVESYITIDKQKGTYCQIGIVASTTSKGSLKDDFESAWQTFIVKPYAPSEEREVLPSETEDGWSGQVGVVPFEYGGAPSVATLITATGYGRSMSMVILTNSKEYQSDLDKFLSSVEFFKPDY